MHIREYRKIKPQEVDSSILERISEDEICLWMAARLAKLREDGLSVNIDLRVNFRSYYGGNEQYYDVGWTLHGYGEVAMTHKTIDSAVRELREIVACNPRQKAEQKRAEAQRLIKEAEELAALAQGRRE